MKSTCKDPIRLTVDGLIAEAIELSAALAHKLQSGRDARQLFSELAVVLESLPLAQGEYGWLTCRLSNAAGYALQDERHVAVWEIGQLNRRLRTLHQLCNARDGSSTAQSAPAGTT
jgi:hypothetical protein